VRDFQRSVDYILETHNSIEKNGMNRRKISPALPGLRKGECGMSLGLRLLDEELELLLGREDGSEAF